MEDIKRNGHLAECIPAITANPPPILTPAAGNKKDKRRQQIGTRLSKMETSFADDRNNFYRGLLHNLQNTLASIQQGTNEDYVRHKSSLENDRDAELTRLRLWEEYQVKRVEDEYKETVSAATSNYDMMVKLLKEKYYDKLQKQVKQLKEDKLLLNLVNGSSWNAPSSSSSSSSAANSYSTVSALNAAAAASSLNLTDRRSLRKREFSSRFTAGEADDFSDSGTASMSMTGHLRNGTGNGHMASGYVSASSTKRRRHYQTRYSSNDELSAGMHSSGNGHNGGHWLIMAPAWALEAATIVTSAIRITIP
ncbi:hypothetical protein JCM33374_g1060 [Metschnikowia sp. JCM 33374]|nr:hypothetical protein JCM33374_g1060 [Metschnikowia sp. JCM 33374]